jgi:hypothetical protein
MELNTLRANDAKQKPKMNSTAKNKIEKKTGHAEGNAHLRGPRPSNSIDAWMFII